MRLASQLVCMKDNPPPTNCFFYGELANRKRSPNNPRKRYKNSLEENTKSSEVDVKE